MTPHMTPKFKPPTFTSWYLHDGRTPILEESVDATLPIWMDVEENCTWGIMENPQQPQNGQRAPPRKRSSRKGLPRRFPCQHIGCDKQYSRAEHLQRHALNHKPKQVYRCQDGICQQSFVRQDLFDRHVKKHRHTHSWSESIHNTPPTQEECDTVACETRHVVDQHALVTTLSPAIQNVDETLPGDLTATAPTNWDFALQPFEDAVLNTAQRDDAFGNWLLSPLGSHGWDLDVAQLPLLDYSSQFDVGSSMSASYPSALIANAEHNTSTNTADGGGICNSVSLGSSACRDRHIRISAAQLSKITDLLELFHLKNTANSGLADIPSTSLFYRTPEGLWPNIHTHVLEKCVMFFWQDVATQIPIVHQATFRAENAPVPLLLAIISLGASHLVRINEPKAMIDYRQLADLIITGLRWEIHANENAQPPVSLWVAQALLLLEFYEKMFSSRQLHERAHIHHVSTLTLLQRGSSLGGLTDPDTPLDAPGSPVIGERGSTHETNDLDTWWRRWVSNEAMVRVVFTAYEMDTLHAAIFGHESSLLPSDVGLTLPCDDMLWTAESPDKVRQLETSLCLYGIRPTKFLDGLKSYLHGKPSHVHLRGRLTLFSGLLSVGYHTRQREKNNKLFEAVPSQAERKKWTAMVLRALEQWKQGIDDALSITSGRRTSPRPRSHSRLMTEPMVLYHLAYITMHVDILNCQILAGSEILLGRRVSRKELSNARSYATTWTSTFEARLAVLHSFKLLSHVLGANQPNSQESVDRLPSLTEYSSRSDPYIYRPWCLYLAALTIWMYHYIIAQRQTEDLLSPAATEVSMKQAACEYTSLLAECNDPNEIEDRTSKQGCNVILQTLSDNLAIAEPTILVEASKTLRKCRVLLESSP